MQIFIDHVILSDDSFSYMIVFKIIPKAGHGNTCLESEHLIVEAETW